MKSEVINHLETAHQAVTWKTEASGENINRYWYISHHDKQKKDLKLKPAITSFDGNTFFFICILQNWTRSFYVSVLGSEKVAESYDVEIWISDKPANFYIILSTTLL